jgi:hypothetical protein
MSRPKPPTPLQLLLGTAHRTTVKPFPEYLRANFRKAFWEAAIFWWGMMGLLVIGLVIVLAVNGEYYGAIVAFGAGIPVGGLLGAMASVGMARSLLHGRWMQALHEEQLDLLDATDDTTKEPS